MPAAILNMRPLYFIQTTKEVLIIGQFNNVVRRIVLNQQHSPAPKPSWYGDREAGPFVTQAADADTVRRDLQTCHAVMRSDLARPPGSITAGAGVYAGMGVNQNALNHYVFVHWIQGDYNIDISDAADLVRIAALAPPGTFVTVLTRVHAWPASCEASLNTSQAMFGGRLSSKIVFPLLSEPNRLETLRHRDWSRFYRPAGDARH